MLSLQKLCPDHIRYTIASMRVALRLYSQLVLRLWCDEQGVTSVEYAIFLSCFGIGTLASLSLVSTAAAAQYSSMAGATLSVQTDGAISMVVPDAP